MEKVLKQRLITALILAPIAVALILLLPTEYFAVILGIVLCFAAWEWGGLVAAPTDSRASRATFIVAVILLMVVCWFGFFKADTFLISVVALALLWWLIVFALVLRYPRRSLLMSTTLGKAVAGVLILIPAWLSVVALHGTGAQGPNWVLYLIVMVWIADIGAYFVGRAWGRNKLAPAVSPGKSWEGVIGALVFVVLYAFAGAAWLGILAQGLATVAAFVSLSAATAFISVLGDLAESMFKRQANIKDSGSLLPGHGGVMDRIDSLTAAGPVFVAGLWLLDFPQNLAQFQVGAGGIVAP
jgi:phosphatidate cytidylyltransferase